MVDANTPAPLSVQLLLVHLLDTPKISEKIRIAVSSAEVDLTWAQDLNQLADLLEDCDKQYLRALL